MSKRSFSEYDEVIATHLVGGIASDFKKSIESIQRIELDITERSEKLLRVGFATNNKDNTITKALRLFIRHEYHELSHDDRPHYIIFVEGSLFDDSNKAWKFGNFFDKIKICIEKKNHQQSVEIEWCIDENQNEAGTDCFRFKIYYDEKPVTANIYLTRCNDVRIRYDISISLRKILPKIKSNPTIDEVFLAMWQYLKLLNLIDRKLIRCNADLEELFGVQILPLNSLRQKLLDHLTLCRPLQISYNLNPILSTDSKIMMSASSKSKYLKDNMMASFDIEVDVIDPYAAAQVNLINKFHRERMDVQAKISTNIAAVHYITKTLVNTRNREKRREILLDKALQKISMAKKLEKLFPSFPHSFQARQTQGMHTDIPIPWLVDFNSYFHNDLSSSANNTPPSMMLLSASVLSQIDPYLAISNRALPEMLAMKSDLLNLQATLARQEEQEQEHGDDDEEDDDGEDNEDEAEDMLDEVEEQGRSKFTVDAGIKVDIADQGQIQSSSMGGALPRILAHVHARVPQVPAAHHGDAELERYNKSKPTHTHWSAIHTQRGFLDVDDHNLFSFPWLKSGIPTLLQEKLATVGKKDQH